MTNKDYEAALAVIERFVYRDDKIELLNVEEHTKLISENLDSLRQACKKAALYDKMIDDLNDKQDSTSC